MSRGRSNHSLRTQKGRPVTAADLRDYLSQVEVVAGAGFALNLQSLNKQRPSCLYRVSDRVAALFYTAA